MVENLEACQNHPDNLAQMVLGNNSGDDEDSSPRPPAARKPFEYYVSGSDPELHEATYNQVVSLLLDKGLFFNSAVERQKPPYRFLRPELLTTEIDLTLGARPLLHPGSPGASAEELSNIIGLLFYYSPHPSHPFMVSKNSAGLDPYGILGDLLSTVLSQPHGTYFVSPVFTLMEIEVCRQYRNLVGYPENEGDGVHVASHGQGNAFAIQMAIQERFPGAKEKGILGIGNPRMAIFVSDQADYGFEKYCIWEGLGRTACKRIMTDNLGRMDVLELKREIEKCEMKGVMPIMVVATAGTNVLGTIDPIRLIAEVAAQHRLWLHVDGHLAGSCVFSQEHETRLNGIERSDSVVWSADKMLAAPFISCMIVTRKAEKLRETFDLSSDSPYLSEPFYDHKKWDPRVRTMQLTTRPDILKIWLMWKVKGRKGLGDQVDGTYRLAALCLQELRAGFPKFQTILQEFDCNLVCFFYVPEGLRKYNTEQEYLGKILNENKVTETIKNRLLQEGKMQISLGMLEGNPKFFVMNLNNTSLNIEDIRYMLALIEFYGEQVMINAEEKDQTGRLGKVPSVPPAPLSYPDYVSAPIESIHKTMFEEFFKVVLGKGIYFQNKRESSPHRYYKPEELLQKFPISLAETSNSSDSSPQTEEYLSVEGIIKIVEDILLLHPSRGHPYYMYHLVQTVEPYTLIADWVATCLASPMYTFEDGPVYMLMEKELELSLAKKVKYEEGAFLSLAGGSMGNQLPIYLAYIKKFPQAKEFGINGVEVQGVIFCSDAAHYCTIKGAFFQGIGVDNCVLVKTDSKGSIMDCQDLKQKVRKSIEEGKVPFMVCATVGTTTLGAFDSVDEISDVCQEYGMWLHMDGAYGGSLIFSDSQRFRLEAIERSDSFTFNANKMFGSTVYSTNWITKHKEILRDANPDPSLQQFRLNPGLYDQVGYDHGETHALTDRRPDVIKMWLLWKMKGTNGLEKHIDRCYELASYAHGRLLELSGKDERFQRVINSVQDTPDVNFWYVPQEVGDVQHPARREKLSLVQTTLQMEMIKNGKLSLATHAHGDGPDHLIFSFGNSCLDESDIDYFFQLVQYYGERLDWDQILNASGAVKKTSGISGAIGGPIVCTLSHGGDMDGPGLDPPGPISGGSNVPLRNGGVGGKDIAGKWVCAPENWTKTLGQINTFAGDGSNTKEH